MVSMNPIEIINYLNEKLAKMSRERTVIEAPGLSDNDVPTQQDKPSAHSSITLRGLQRIAYAACKEARSVGDGIDLEYVGVGPTNSMEPFIDDNCIVLLEKTPEGTVFWPGDIVIYRAPSGNLIIHRLKQKVNSGNEEYWIIQGDNNKGVDLYRLKEKDIIKRYVGHFVSRPVREND